MVRRIGGRMTTIADDAQLGAVGRRMLRIAATVAATATSPSRREQPLASDLWKNASLVQGLREVLSVILPDELRAELLSTVEDKIEEDDGFVHSVVQAVVRVVRCDTEVGSHSAQARLTAGVVNDKIGELLNIDDLLEVVINVDVELLKGLEL